MKTRQGFVSNSSSSSFCLVTTKQAHLKALESMGSRRDDVQAVLDEMGFKETTLGGLEIVMVGDLVIMDKSILEFGYELYEEYENALDTDGAEIATWSVG